MNIAKVIVDVPASVINQTFDYLIPEKFRDMLKPGMRVTVPFGARKIMGYVVGITAESQFNKLKEIHDVLDVTPVLTRELLELGKWLADKTLCMYIIAYQAMVPQVFKAQYKKEIVRLTEAELSFDLEKLFAGRDVLPYELLDNSSVSFYQLQKAVQNGDVEINYLVKSKITQKKVTMIKPNQAPYQLEEALLELPKNAKKQWKLLHFFVEHPEEIEQNRLIKHLQTSRSTIKALIDKSLLISTKVEVYRNPYDDKSYPQTTPLELTPQQQKAITPINEAIIKSEHHVFLLHGVTGSGKTEVYLQAIQHVINKGKEAIVLVPEISLTPQMVKRFKGRFGSNVAVLHSALSNGERYDEWRRIHRKEVQVVVGARSAIFAPFENIGIIIIDEEHETTYKQEDQPRYHARDVAIYRGKNHHCPVVLGSATPTLESYARAQKGVYQLATLSKRTNEKDMPEVEVIDMRKELHKGNRTMFSIKLKEKIEACIQNDEQIVLMLNRRGFS